MTSLGDGAVLGRWHHPTDDGRIQCDLCPRACRLRDGQRAFCFVRQRVGDELALTSYGRATGFCIDPIEKKPLNHFYPGSSVLSFGTAGCNLGCKFCQNWDISKARAVERLSDAASPEEIAEAAAREGCRSVAFTYNDPVIFAEFAMDTAEACRARGVAAVAVTAGYLGERARADFVGAFDALNVDLKGFSEAFYRDLCAASLEPVKETLRYVARETDTWLEVTTLLIPGQNDSDAELAAMTEWFVEALGPDVPWHFSAFHPDYRMQSLPRTPAETLRRARARAQAVGVSHVYTGNVFDPTGQSTSCAACGAVLVARDGYTVLDYRLVGAACPECRAVLPGRFDPAGPGSWGSRRRRLVLS